MSIIGKLTKVTCIPMLDLLIHRTIREIPDMYMYEAATLLRLVLCYVVLLTGQSVHCKTYTSHVNRHELVTNSDKTFYVLVIPVHSPKNLLFCCDILTSQQNTNSHFLCLHCHGTCGTVLFVCLLSFFQNNKSTGTL